MSDRKANPLFDRIAPCYGWFFEYQKKQFQRVLAAQPHVLDPSLSEKVLDVGCGTGALSSVLAQQGFSVTGIDPAKNMLRVARKKTAHQDIDFIQADVLEGLPFKDKSFDISIASFVAHGLAEPDRRMMYAEMSRVTRFLVILCDYNQNRYGLVSFVEWLEQGDYFNFIKAPQEELNSCLLFGQPCFSEVKVVDIGKWSSFYLCRITDQGAAQQEARLQRTGHEKR